MTYDPDMFRQKVGRFHERWYKDPLPDDDTWTQTDWLGPSISTVKKASGNDWTFVTLKRIAELDADDYMNIAKLTVEDRQTWLRNYTRKALRTAAARGTIVHIWAEDMLDGNQPRDLTEEQVFNMGLPVEALAEARLYLPALEEWFQQQDIQLICKEAVVINRSLNGYGYGGTVDAWVKLNGETCALDWKTRTAHSQHAGYPEEAAQIAAGVNGDYWFQPGEPITRQRIPDMDAAYVISIKPDSVEQYPVNLDEAWNHFQELHRWWTTRRSERDTIGKRVEQPQQQQQTVEHDNLVERCYKIRDAGHQQQLAEHWRPDIPVLKFSDQWTDQHRTAITRIVEQIETEHELPWSDAVPAKPVKPSVETPRATKPDDTQNADADAMETLKTKYAKLNEKQLDYVKHFTSLANKAGHSISLQQTPSVRRFNIATAIIDFSETDDRDILVTALNTISEQPDTGTQLGLLTSTQAIELKTIASHLLSGDPVEITSNNTIKLLEGNQ